MKYALSVYHIRYCPSADCNLEFLLSRVATSSQYPNPEGAGGPGEHLLGTGRVIRYRCHRRQLFTSHPPKFEGAGWSRYIPLYFGIEHNLDTCPTWETICSSQHLFTCLPLSDEHPSWYVCRHTPHTHMCSHGPRIQRSNGCNSGSTESSALATTCGCPRGT